MDNSVNKNILHSVDTALQLMDLFETAPHLSLSEISNALGVGKSTAFRLCATLERRGYIQKSDKTSYGLGSRFLSLGAVASDRSVLIPMLRPLMTKLMEETEETVHLVVWVDAYRVLLVEHVLCQGSIRVVNDVRTPRYPHTTSTGMTLLAAKPDEYIRDYLTTVPITPLTSFSYQSADEIWQAIYEVRERGYAINDQQYELGLVSIAVPIKNHSGHPVAAMSVSGADTRIKSKIDMILDRLRETAESAYNLPL